MQLSNNIEKLLGSIITMLGVTNATAVSKLSSEVQQMRDRLDEPLRVAIVGVMKAGKSTLINAMMKERILSTGTLETTYTVSWFKYGESAHLKVLFKDGTEQTAPFSDLAKWTVRPVGVEKHRLDDVACVHIYYPNEILKTMELIDTPGLESTHGTDAQNTLDFLGQRLTAEADKISTETASQAEAIIYGFTRGASARDAEVLDAFRGEGDNSSPINAIGVFTKADVFWNCAAAPESSPLDIVSNACAGYAQRLHDKLYTICPVVAKATETAFANDRKAMDILRRLASVEKAVFLDFLADASVFCCEPQDGMMPVAPGDRKYVLDQFGQYGIYAAVNALQNGISIEAIPEYLYEISGVKRAVNLVLRHFGNRAYLIKLDYILRRIHILANQVKHNDHADTNAVRLCDYIIEEIDSLRQNEQSFRELEALKMYYNGDLAFQNADLEKQFLQITGEFGSTCEARLGVACPTSIVHMKQAALQCTQRWSVITNDFRASRNMTTAARIVVRSYENLYYHLDMLSGFEE